MGSRLVTNNEEDKKQKEKIEEHNRKASALRNITFNTLLLIVISIFTSEIKDRFGIIAEEVSIKTAIIQMIAIFIILIVTALIENYIDKENKVTVSKLMSTKGRNEVITNTFEISHNGYIDVLNFSATICNLCAYIMLGAVLACITFRQNILYIVLILGIINIIVMIITHKVLSNNTEVKRFLVKLSDIYMKIAFSYMVSLIIK